MKQFHQPKAFDPSLADRPMNGGYGPGGYVNPKVQKLQDLGFEPSAVEAPGGDLEDKCSILQEQLDECKAKMAEQERELDTLREKEKKEAAKLQSFQQVNRSQSALMRSELQKHRRRLAHAQAVCAVLRDRSEWFQAQCPAMALPSEMTHMPTEEDAVEEAGELVTLHRRWENDVAQLQAEILASAAPGNGAKSAAGGVSAAEVEQLRKHVALLEKEMEQQRLEAPAAPMPPAGPPPAEGGASTAEVEALRKELEASQKEAKENMKKLKQLAQVYKTLEKGKNDLEAQLAAAGAKVVAKQLPPELVQRVQEQLADERRKMEEFKISVRRDMQVTMPAQLEEALKLKMAELKTAMDAGNKMWIDKYNVECEKRRKLHNLVQELKGNIRVYCRVRPMNEREIPNGSCISFPSPGEIKIYNEATSAGKTWAFNEVLDPSTTQEDLFATVRDLVVSVVDGFNVCIFAYGQTGSGKTHSMQGNSENPGMYPRTFNELFKVAQERKGWKVDLKTAVVEIYNDEIRDLLLDPEEKNKPKLQGRQGKEGNFVPNLTMKDVTAPSEVSELLELATKNRTVACTDMNSHSSRSHLLVQVYSKTVDANGKEKSSVLTLVDLAGSERIAKSGVSGDRAKEAIAINKSLSALGDVINSRATKSAHTPFRNSTLTHMLQDSLSGDSKTLMLLQINPCAEHVEESTCSLQFGARVNAVELKK